MAEALPYLRQARAVSVIVTVSDDEPTRWEGNAREGVSCGSIISSSTTIDASLALTPGPRRATSRDAHDEAKQRKAIFIVMGGYGHSRMREWLLGRHNLRASHGAHVSAPGCRIARTQKSGLRADDASAKLRRTVLCPPMDPASSDPDISSHRGARVKPARPGR